MENLNEKSPVYSYDPPAVIYEAALVAHALTSSVCSEINPNCCTPNGDILP